jgi:hypothetical protein
MDKGSERTRWRWVSDRISCLEFYIHDTQIIIYSNVLKLRKEAEQGSGEAETSSTRASRLPAQKVIQSPPKRKSQVGKKRAETGSKTTSASSPKPGVPDVNHALDLYTKEFRVRVPLLSIAQKGN